MGKDYISHLVSVVSPYLSAFILPGKNPGGWREASWSSHHSVGYTQPYMWYQSGTRHLIHVRSLYFLQFPTLLSSLAPHRFSSFPLISPTQLSQDVKHGDMAERGLDLK